jgi:glycosyltransferase involved in cell wall biosynthesis
MVYAGILASNLKKIFKIPIVVTEHSSYYARNLFKPFTIKNVDYALNNIDKFITVSKSLGDYLTTKFKSLVEYEYVPNVLDQVFVESMFEKRKTNDIFTFINIGSFIEIKGQKNLIEAFALKFGKDISVKLKIIGGGELKEVLRELAISKEVENQVEIIDGLPRNRIIEELDTADVFVFSSHYETFGVALIEALSRGLPVVSTKCGGPESIVNKSNGILVGNDNIINLANGLEYMRKKIDNYNSKLIREQCLNEFGPLSFYEKILKVYIDVINHDC